jgi:hypothetical protein
MKENVQSTGQDTWMSRLWGTLVAWDDAMNDSRVRSLAWGARTTPYGGSYADIHDIDELD